MGLRGGGSLEIGAVGCRLFLRPSRAVLVCGIGCADPVNTFAYAESTPRYSAAPGTRYFEGKRSVGRRKISPAHHIS